MKLLGSILLVLAVLFTQVGTVAAAPQTQETTPVTGTIQSITTAVEGDVTVVIVTLEDEQIFRLSVDTAVTLGLVTLDPATGTPTVDETQVGQTVEIDPTTALPEEGADVHPISNLLAEFFDVDASVIDSFHTGDNEAEQVFGFGVIAQALWMATESDGDTSTTDIELTTAILEAKQSGDYSEVAEMLGMDPEDVPSNWGQFKKALKDKHENLGTVVSESDNEDGKGNDKNDKPDKPEKDNKKDKNNKGNNGNKP